MQIIPVLDLLNGVTVQAVAGRRNEYRPVRSQLTDSIDPSVVLKCLDDVCQSGTVYLADLDAILKREPNRCTLAELSRLDLNLMVDAGTRSREEVQDLFDLGIKQAIIGLESLASPAAARELVATFDVDSLIMSLDLKSGIPLAHYKPWTQMSPIVVLKELIEIGFRRWIILDLAAVGTAQGVPTECLCKQLRALRPADEIITGGGVRDHADLRALEDAGVDGVLIASALHNGEIDRLRLGDF
jgi:HisA/HisF family protein